MGCLSPAFCIKHYRGGIGLNLVPEGENSSRYRCEQRNRVGDGAGLFTGRRAGSHLRPGDGKPEQGGADPVAHGEGIRDADGMPPIWNRSRRLRAQPRRNWGRSAAGGEQCGGDHRSRRERHIRRRRWDATVRVCFHSAVYGCQTAFRHMRHTGGVIVNVSSLAARCATAGRKHALWAAQGRRAAVVRSCTARNMPLLGCASTRYCLGLP